MGVGAIFIATLAKLDLPLAARETEEPQTQTELLAATIQPIVAFMVLCSVVCRKSADRPCTRAAKSLYRRIIHSLLLLDSTSPFLDAHMVTSIHG
jgi:hypothetical protein